MSELGKKSPTSPSKLPKRRIGRRLYASLAPSCRAAILVVSIIALGISAAVLFLGARSYRQALDFGWSGIDGQKQNPIVTYDCSFALERGYISCVYSRNEVCVMPSAKVITYRKKALENGGLGWYIVSREDRSTFTEIESNNMIANRCAWIYWFWVSDDKTRFQDDGDALLTNVDLRGYFAFPIWWLGVLPLITPLPYQVLSAFKRNYRLRKGRCRKCGYDLRGSSERCPECGTMRPTEPLASM